VTATKPSLDLLRELSDEHVLTALMGEPRLTRAELASRIGISKPTVGQSVRRLVTAGIVVDTGERTTGRGRVGSYYALAGTIGCALAVSIAPEGISAELIDAHDTVLARSTRTVPRSARPARVAASLVDVCRRVQAATSSPTRLAVVSAADPVDRETGRLVHLPDAPFLLGNLSPVDVLSPFIDGPITVDNDVNWAARAERAAAPGTLDDFVYLYFGEGLGCAVVSDGDVRRGHHGLAGEIAHLVTTGTDGRACPLTEVFHQLGLRHPGSTAIDVAALTAAVDATGRRARTVRAALGQAIGGAISAAVALTDPAVIVVGGSWGTHPAVLDAVTAHSTRLPRRPALRPAMLVTGAALTGARAHAVAELRRSMTEYRHTMSTAGSPGR
jgi:predicted NBD/HSP70 family sugar kinase